LDESNFVDYSIPDGTINSELTKLIVAEQFEDPEAQTKRSEVI